MQDHVFMQADNSWNPFETKLRHTFVVHLSSPSANYLVRLAFDKYEPSPAKSDHSNPAQIIRPSLGVSFRGRDKQ